LDTAAWYLENSHARLLLYKASRICCGIPSGFTAGDTMVPVPW